MTAFLFPGQGAQTPEFLDALPDEQVVKDTLAEANDVLGVDVLSLDSQEALQSTINVQLTVLIAGTAATRVLMAHGVQPDAVAGISIGSFTAAVAAGAIAFRDALTLVKLRATLMEKAYPTGYGMASFGGLRQRQLEQLAQNAERPGEPLYLANFNAPVEIVVTGSMPALERLVTAAKAAGARRAQLLAVSVPSHCPLLDSVSTALSDAIRHYEIHAPKITYVGNRTARVLSDASAVSTELATNVSHPVKWYDSTTLLYELGERAFIEAPPGNVLTSLMNDAFPDARTHAMANTPLSTLIYLYQGR